MAKKSSITETMRKSVEGTLILTDGEVVVDVEETGKITFKELFRKYDGELVKISVAVSNKE